MNIVDYCYKNKIKYLPVKLIIDESGKHHPSVTHPYSWDHENGFRATSDGTFEDNHLNFGSSSFKELTLKQCQGLYDTYGDETDWIIIDCSKVNQVDIDDTKGIYWDSEMAKNYKDHPYFLSATKEMPHYFAKFDLRNKHCEEIDCPHDLLYGGFFSYALKTQIVQNADTPIPNLVFTKQVKKTISKTSKSKAKIVSEPNKESDMSLQHKIVDLIAVEPYLNEYDLWMRVVCALKNEGFSEEFARNISMKSNKFTEESFFRMWGTELANISMGTLKYYARLSDPDEYNELFAKEERVDLNTTDFGLAKKFYELVGDDVVYQFGVMYLYDQSSNQWFIDAKCERVKTKFVKTMSQYMSILLRQATKSESGEDKIKQISKSIASCQSHKKATECVNMLKCILAENGTSVKFDVGEEQMYNIQFKNGVYELNTKIFRRRQKTDYVTLILDYDYIEKNEVTKEAVAEVFLFFKKLQPDEEQLRFTLSYLAYCLTGNTGHQIMKMNVGYTASNGKSTEVYIHQIVFPIYTRKLDKRTFNKNFDKRHKEFLCIIREPIRLAYIEELNRTKIDEGVFKDFVDGKNLEVEILYGTKEEAKMHAKLLTNSNKDANMENDEGTLRRVKVQEYNSKFDKSRTTDDWENHVFVGRDNYENLYKNPMYKNAYFHLLLGYIDNLHVPESATKAFKDIAADYDEFVNLLENKYEITKKETDLIPKVDIEDYFSNKKWPWVLSELKRVGLKYNRDKRINTGQQTVRGVVTGLKIIDDDDDDDCYYKDGTFYNCKTNEPVP